MSIIQETICPHTPCRHFEIINTETGYHSLQLSQEGSQTLLRDDIKKFERKIEEYYPFIIRGRVVLIEELHTITGSDGYGRIRSSYLITSSFKEHQPRFAWINREKADRRWRDDIEESRRLDDRAIRPRYSYEYEGRPIDVSSFRPGLSGGKGGTPKEALQDAIKTMICGFSRGEKEKELMLFQESCTRDDSFHFASVFVPAIE